MANLEQELDEKKMLLRVLAYGPAKTKKTWWAAKAAESNFNVILLDGDDGWHILKNIDKQYQKRISVIRMVDTHKSAAFCKGMTTLLKEYKLVWDEVKKQSSKLQPNANCIYLNFETLTRNDVVIVDSWTALTYSLMFQFAMENDIDISDANKVEWDGYGWAGRIATWMINQLQALPCHVIVIGHRTVYEKRSKDGKTVESQRQQLASTSGNHAATMPGKFSDILTFSIKGASYKIDTSGDYDRDGGSRLFPPKIYNWEELQFKDLILAAGNVLPDVTNPYIDIKTQFSNVAVGQIPITATKPLPIVAPTKLITGGTVNANLKNLTNLIKPKLKL